jgi:hypothetical protein
MGWAKAIVFCPVLLNRILVILLSLEFSARLKDCQRMMSSSKDEVNMFPILLYPIGTHGCVKSYSNSNQFADEFSGWQWQQN